MVQATESKINGKHNGNGRISQQDGDGYHWGGWVRVRASMLGFPDVMGIADHVGCTRQQLGRWLKSKTFPRTISDQRALALCYVLEVDHDVLFTDWEKCHPHNILRKYGGRGRYLLNQMMNQRSVFPEISGEESTDGDRIANMDARYGVPVPIGALVTTGRGDAIVIDGTEQLAILQDEKGQQYAERWGVLSVQASGPAFCIKHRSASV